MTGIGWAELSILLFSFIPMIGVLIGYILLLVAVWRAMRAHESIARSLQQIAAQGPRGPEV